jgi:hypothetical protein
MKSWMRPGLASAAIMLAGCQTAATAMPGIVQDVEFLRGCWVQKDEPGGRALGFLRLLPEGVDGPVYRGDLMEVGLAGDTISPGAFGFSRDGSSMTMRIGEERTETTLPHGRLTLDYPEPARGKRAVFGGTRPDGSRAPFVIAESDGEHLWIFFASQSGRSIQGLVGMERDGCD